MSDERTPIPSHLAGEGAERTRLVSEAGASPGRSLCARPPSPARGEARSSPTARKSVHKQGLIAKARVLRSRMTDAERKIWFALRDGDLLNSNSGDESQSAHSSPISFASRPVWSSKWTAVNTRTLHAT